jgi:hypothetical protein
MMERSNREPATPPVCCRLPLCRRRRPRASSSWWPGSSCTAAGMAAWTSSCRKRARLGVRGSGIDGGVSGVKKTAAMIRRGGAVGRVRGGYGLVQCRLDQVRHHDLRVTTHGSRLPHGYHIPAARRSCPQSLCRVLRRAVTCASCVCVCLASSLAVVVETSRSQPRLFVFGGTDGDFQYLGDIHVLDFGMLHSPTATYARYVADAEGRGHRTSASRGRCAVAVQAGPAVRK